jgi:hypothetical protein
MTMIRNKGMHNGKEFLVKPPFRNAKTTLCNLPVKYIPKFVEALGMGSDFGSGKEMGPVTQALSAVRDYLVLDMD